MLGHGVFKLMRRLWCGRCGEVVDAGEAEACHVCLGDLCWYCWNEHGECGHGEEQSKKADLQEDAWPGPCTRCGSTDTERVGEGRYLCAGCERTFYLRPGKESLTCSRQQKSSDDLLSDERLLELVDEIGCFFDYNPGGLPSPRSRSPEAIIRAAISEAEAAEQKACIKIVKRECAGRVVAIGQDIVAAILARGKEDLTCCPQQRRCESC